MSVHILLGAADGGLSSRLVAQFRELPEFELHAVETTSRDVETTVAATPQLDVALVHQALGPLPALELIRDLVTRHPQLAVILIADEANAETFAAAMAAGARGVISYDPTLSELQNRVQQAAEWSRTMRRHFGSALPSSDTGGRGTLLTLCGAKGGVGTTTIAIHLAVAVAGAGHTVCLVELDLQGGDLSGYLDVKHRHSIADLALAGDLDGAVVADALFVHPLGPHLLLAPAHGEDAEDISARAVRQILTVLRSRYDVVIVDGGGHVADANAMAVELADELVIVATPDVPALRAAKRLSKLFARLAIRKEEDTSVLLTKHDRRNEIQPELARKMVSGTLRGVVVPAGFRALEEAANTGAPDAVKNSDFRKAIGRLAVDLGLLERGGAQPGKDRGGVSIEFAALLPLVVVIGLLCWQVVLVGLTSMYASVAANEAARAVAVLGYDESDTPQARRNREAVRSRAVQGVYGHWKDREHLHLDVDDDYVVVTIDTPVLLPGMRSEWNITAKAKVVDEGVP